MSYKLRYKWMNELNYQNLNIKWPLSFARGVKIIGVYKLTVPDPEKVNQLDSRKMLRDIQDKIPQKDQMWQKFDKVLDQLNDNRPEEFIDMQEEENKNIYILWKLEQLSNFEMMYCETVLGNEAKQ